MNGYVEFQTIDGDMVTINADRVNYVRRFRGGDQASAINFEKGHYVVVQGGLAEVSEALSQA
jgi:F0F1-type ATP synthase epsilon subunit